MTALPGDAEDLVDLLEPEAAQNRRLHADLRGGHQDEAERDVDLLGRPPLRGRLIAAVGLRGRAAELIDFVRLGAGGKTPVRHFLGEELVEPGVFADVLFDGEEDHRVGVPHALDVEVLDGGHELRARLGTRHDVVVPGLDVDGGRRQTEHFKERLHLFAGDVLRRVVVLRREAAAGGFENLSNGFGHGGTSAKGVLCRTIL